MYNTAKITFRATEAPFSLYTPEFMYDVIAMRGHPDYTELAADGSAVTQPTDGLQRPLMSVDNVKTLAPSQPTAPKKGKTNLTAGRGRK